MRQSIISLVASIVAAIVMFIPFAFILLAPDSSATSTDTNNSWQRGLVALPVVFFVAVFFCSAAARWLLVKCWCSFKHFTLGASAIGSALAIVLCIPAVLVGSYVGMFTLQSALMPVLSFAGVLFVSSVPAAAVWWFIVSKTHNLDARAGRAKAR